MATIDPYIWFGPGMTWFVGFVSGMIVIVLCLAIEEKRASWLQIITVASLIICANLSLVFVKLN